MKILITGGLGFVGHSLANFLSNEIKNIDIDLIDCLASQSSKINYSKNNKNYNIKIHNLSNKLTKSKNDYDFIIMCASNPAVKTGLGEDLNTVFQNNFNSTVNTLELSSKKTKIIYISSSRVYDSSLLNSLKLNYNYKKKRLSYNLNKNIYGISKQGISENFSTKNSNSYYGFSKIYSEEILRFYCQLNGIKYLILRPGIICGPGQYGNKSQGIVSYWLFSYLLKRNDLSYIGYKGTGFQIRDFLNIEDFNKYIYYFINNFNKTEKSIFNIGGGEKNSFSLYHLNDEIKKFLPYKMRIKRKFRNNEFDIPIYLSNERKVKKYIKIHKKTLTETLEETLEWGIKEIKSLKKIY